MSMGRGKGERGERGERFSAGGGGESSTWKVLGVGDVSVWILEERYFLEF